MREGRVLRREDCEAHSRLMKIGPGQWTACLLVEEPMDRTNAARSVFCWDILTLGNWKYFCLQSGL